MSPQLHIMQVYDTKPGQPHGGVDVVVQNLLATMAEEHRSLLLRPAPWTQKKMRQTVEQGVPVFSMPLPLPPGKWWNWKGWGIFLLHSVPAFLQLRRTLRLQNVDVIHLHTLQHYQVYFAINRLFGGVPYLLTLHRAEVLAYPQRAWATRRSWRAVLEKAGAVNAVSDWLAGIASQNMPFLGSVATVQNGIDFPSDTRRDRKILAKSLGIDLPERYCIAVGVLKPYKAHALAIEAWAKLGKHVAETPLLIVGDGELRAELENMISKLGVVNRVRLLGVQSRDVVLDLMSHAAGVVMPSLSEGLPIVLLEAGALQVPVICSDIGPFRELVEDGVSGMVFEGGNSTALAAKVEQILADPDRARALAEAYSKRIRERFNLAKMGASYVALYHQAIGSGSR